MAKSENQDIENAIQEILAQNARKKAAEAEAGDASGDTDLQDDEAPADGDDDLHAQIEALQAERDQLHDRFMRALADAENARKRSERDRREAEQYGGSRLGRDLLPVFDNLTRALEAVDDEQRAANKGLIEGVEITLRELIKVFGKHNFEAITPEVGDRFDPRIHEAMFEAPLPGTRAGDIIQVAAVGFMLHDRLLRPAKVGVTSTPAP